MERIHQPTDEELQRVRELQEEARAEYTAAQSRRTAQNHREDLQRTTRRAAVRQLAQRQPELSQRAIAARLNVSKDTVRRDLAHTAGAAAQTDAPPEANPFVPLGVHTALVALAQDARQLARSGDALAHDAAHTREAIATLAHLVAILEQLACASPAQRVELAVLARRLHALADHGART